MQHILAIDTATEACSAALYSNGRQTARFEVAGRSHTERLMPMVLALMADAGLGFAQLDAYVCGIGPGSFAGVRIGVSYVKGLALAHERPTLGVSSLAMLAEPALAAGATQVIAAIDARMDEVYVGLYGRDAQGLPEALQAEAVCPPTAVALAGLDTAAVAVGSGWSRHADALRAALSVSPAQVDAGALPRAGAALRIALPRLQAGGGLAADRLQPVYLRNKVALTLEEQQARNFGPGRSG